MRIGIQTWGSEGDTRPFVALGHALAARGHDVEMVYTEVSDRRYEAVAQSLGFTARAVASPILTDAQLDTIGLKTLSTSDPLRQGLVIAKYIFEPVVEPMFQAGLELAKRCDLLVHHFILYPARAAAELTGTPAISVALAHMLIPSRQIHPHGLPRLCTWGNAIEWAIARLAINMTLGRDGNRFRTRVGLPAFRNFVDEGWPSPLLHLIASSPALLDRPADWPPQYHLCGFLELPAHDNEPLSAEVEAFLSRGPAPVFMEAARLSGRRAIIQADVDRAATDDLLFVRRTPHARVFPRCAAVVHHAGAGTTHTTLRAGVPSVPVPHVSDQFAWSEELERLGVAPRALLRKKWSAPALADRIRQAAGNPRMKAAAVSIQERMATDDGPSTAATLIERAVQNL